MDSGMFYPVQAGAVEALNLSETWFEDQNMIYSRRKAKVMELVQELGCTTKKDQAGLFVWAKVPEGKTAEELVDHLLYEKDIFITPGFIFGKQGDGYIRFSLCATEEVIEEAIKRIRS